MSWEQFYAPARLGNRFGKQGVFYGPRGHLGVDYRHPAGTPIPSWCEGTVANVHYFMRLGHTIIIRRKDGTFAGFCHLKARSKLNIGDHIRVGQTVGLVGSTGTASTGPHLHATLEPSVTIGTGNAIDPLPHIQKATAPKKKTTPTEIPMKVNKRIEGTAEWSLIHPSLAGSDSKQQGYIVTTDPARAREWERMYAQGAGSADGLNRADYIAQQAEARAVRVAWLRGQPTLGGGVAAIALAVEARLADEFAAIPTAGENAAATRNAIIKPA